MTMLNKPRQNDDETRSASWPTDDGHRGNRMSLETATLLAACLSGFLFQVDLTALAAALPDIGRDLGAASARAAWVIDVYSLALIFCLPIAGSLADRYGRVQMFTWGAGLFGLASLLCACANTLDVLLTFRTLQGIAGAASPAPRLPSLPVPTRGLGARGRLDFGAPSSVPRWSLARRSDRSWLIRSGGVGFFGSTCRFAQFWFFWRCAELAMGSTSSAQALR